MLLVGDLLRQEREKKQLTFTQVEKGTKIRAKLIEAVESQRWEAFSSKVYILGVLKIYAVFLGLDPRKVVAYFRRDYERQEEVKFKKRVAAKYFHPETKKIIIALFVFIFVIFFAYFGYQIKLYISPPQVIITEPTKSVFRNTEKIKVVGKTEKEASITIFGERVFTNKDGMFEYNFPIKKGKNVLTIEVAGGNGKKTVVKKEYILE